MYKSNSTSFRGMAIIIFLKFAQARGRTWNLCGFSFIFSHKQRIRPLGYCAPLRMAILLNMSSSLTLENAALVRHPYQQVPRLIGSPYF